MSMRSACANIANPWGMAIKADLIVLGIWWIVAKNGAGYVVGEGPAKRMLSAAARQRGRPYGRYLCYAGPVDHLIVERELRSRQGGEDEHEDAHVTLSVRHADYLEEVGVEPDPKARRLWERATELERRRRAKDPDLIVSARALRPGVVQVTTADGRSHVVDEGRFDQLMERSSVPCLSSCPG